LGKFPRPSAEAKAKQQKAPTKGTVLGLTLAPASAIAGAGEHGVVITEIDPSSRAAESGLQTGDVILDAGRRAVNTPRGGRQDGGGSRLTVEKGSALARSKARHGKLRSGADRLTIAAERTCRGGRRCVAARSFLVDDYPPNMVTRPPSVMLDRVVSNPEMGGTHPRHNKRSAALQHALTALGRWLHCG